MVNEIARTDSFNTGREKLNNAIKAFNETVVEGDSSVEAAQARVNERGKTFDTLKLRIDNLDIELESRAVNVKWFGAVGNANYYNSTDGLYYEDSGFTIPANDDTSAIQTAIDNTNGYILFPEGNYLITSELTLKSNVKVVGNGTYPKIQQNTEDQRIFVGDALTDVHIKGLTLRSYSTTSPFSEKGLIHITNSTNIVVRDNRVKETRSGVWVQACTNVFVTENEVDTFEFIGIVVSRCKNFYVLYNNVHDSTVTNGSYSYGIQATGNSTNIQEKGRIIGNTIQNIPSWDAIMCHGGDDLIVAENITRNTRNGIDFNYAQTSGAFIGNLKIINNDLEGTNTDTWAGSSALNNGINILGNINATTSNKIIKNVHISGNRIVNFGNFNNSTAGGGIGVRDVDGVSITENIIKDIGDGNGEQYWGGISLNRSIQNVSVRGNIIENTSIMGITFRLASDVKNVIVKENIIKCTDATMNDGIRINSANFVDADITENKVNGIPNNVRVSNAFYPGINPYSDGLTITDASSNPVSDLYKRVGYYYLEFRSDIEASGTNTSGSTSLNVTDTTGVAVGDVVHIAYQDENRYLSTTVASIVDADTLTINDSLPEDIPAGNDVYVVRWVNKG